MDLLQIFLLALIQGVTEFLPISSSAHLILAAHFGTWADQGLAFDIALHLGSLLAVLAYFRRELSQLIKAGVPGLVSGPLNPHSRLLINLAIATLPLGILGLLLKSWVEMNLRSELVIALATILFGLLLWVADRFDQRKPRTQQHNEFQLDWRGAVWIGLAQTLAMIPGTSRSGITITAALFLGLTREGAARFSFLLSIPAILGAGLVGGLDIAQDIASHTSSLSYTDLALGVLLSGLSAYACIHVFINLLEKTGMAPYVIYRLLLGSVLLYLTLG